MATQGAKPKKTRQERKAQDDAETEAFKEEHKFYYHNLPLGDMEKDDIVANPITPERLAKLLDDLIYSGYKFGGSYDWVHKCHVISITGVKLWREDYNACITSRHADLWVALASAEYKWLRFIKAGTLERTAEATKEIFD